MNGVKVGLGLAFVAAWFAAITIYWITYKGGLF
jgi:hypothetical protein